MPLSNIEYNVTVEASNADFNNDIYYQVYAKSATTLTVNGFSISMEADTKVNMLVKSISATPGIYVLGNKRYSVEPPTTLSNYPEPQPIGPVPIGDFVITESEDYIITESGDLVIIE